jgi:septum formation protein
MNGKKDNLELPPIILASGSPRRAQLLREMELDFQVLPASVDESASEHLTPRELCLLNAYHKARAVAKDHPDDVVLGADTVVCLGKKIFGKPATIAEAHDMLAELQGHTHQVLTGVCLLRWRTHAQRLFAEASFVTFHRLTELEIRHYLERIEPLDKAGAYAIQDNGDMIAERVEGSMSNVIGLPVERLLEELAGWRLENTGRQDPSSQ